MPKTPVKAEINTFVGGLVTEASPLNFPPNSSPDMENFQLNRDGSLQRRFGMDLEANFVLFDPPTAANNIYPPNPVTFKWTNVAGISDFTVLVCQFDNSLIFFNLDKENLSREGEIGRLDLTQFPKDVQFSLSSEDGRLVAVAGVEKIALITYDSGVFNVRYDVLRTRDMWGVEGTDSEGAKYESDPLYRGSVLSNAHIYNLQNQSWGTSKTRDTDGAVADPISHYRDQLGLYPSNSEQVWAGLQYKPDGSGNPTERYYPSMSRDLFGTAGLSAKGFYIIDVISRGASRLRAVNESYANRGAATIAYTVPTNPDYTNGGATCVAGFAGRIFYAGFSGETIGGDARSPVLSNYVFFSQLVRSTNDLVKCYQQGDPTSRDDSDILETDGGFVKIAGADRIIRMITIGSSLVVICSNGVWAISGGSDYGFSATNYRVDKVSSFGCLSPQSVVEEKGRVFFWGEDGIFVVAKSQLGDLAVENISRGRIDKFYQALSVFSKTNSVGVYDFYSGKILWIYNVEGSFNNYELVLDTALSSFALNRVNGIISGKTVKLVSLFTTSPFSTAASTEEVFSATDLVSADLDTVVVDAETVGTGLSTVKYLVAITDGDVTKFSFSSYRNIDFYDWSLVDGVGADATAYGLTGAMIVGDSSVRKQLQFLTMHFKRTEEDSVNGVVNTSSCLLGTRWDWASEAASLKWSALKQAYRHSKPQDVINFDVVSSRNMLRGQGRALAIYFETEPGKNCHILGWNLAADGNART